MDTEDPANSRKVLKPLSCLLPDAGKNAALVILNQPLEKQLLKQLWKCSLYKAVADGGTDRLISCLGSEKDQFIPDVITGDFDSATESALNFYDEKAVQRVPTPDQNETDFTKCLRITIENIKTQSLPVEQYLVMGSYGGRFDQEFANLSTLFQAATLTDQPVYLISQGNLSCLLRSGKTDIQTDTGLEAESCGLIPIGCRCDHVTTTGLKWNLDNQSMAFGELVSTSNTYSSDVITVETDQPLLWTMCYNFPKHDTPNPGPEPPGKEEEGPALQQLEARC